MPQPPKATFTPPMKVGDSTLMMLLSLNLLLLVFFMMLNSMATYGKKHAEEVLATVRHGYNVQMDGKQVGGVDIPEVPQAAWRAGVLTRLNGVVINRIDLRVPPQEANAGKVEMEIPLAAVFDTNGKVMKPELLRNMIAAAGADSSVHWEIVGHWDSAARLAPMVAALAAQTGQAEMVAGTDEFVRVTVSPGTTTLPEMGLKVQSLGEGAGGRVQGVDERISE